VFGRDRHSSISGERSITGGGSTAQESLLTDVRIKNSYCGAPRVLLLLLLLMMMELQSLAVVVPVTSLD
jgi:hypothetical protein